MMTNVARFLGLMMTRITRLPEAQSHDDMKHEQRREIGEMGRNYICRIKLVNISLQFKLNKRNESKSELKKKNSRQILFNREYKD